MRIQFFSDIHLEFGDFQVPQTDADVIVAAGDVGVGIQGIEWLLELDKPVIYIAGNHEFYRGDLSYTREAISQFAHGSSVHYLENSVVEINNTRFIGCTLWTDFSQADEEIMFIARQNMNDYFYIQNQGESLLPEHLLALHQESMAWLKEELSRDYHGNTVVVSHHAPSPLSWRFDADSPIRNAYFSNALEQLTGHSVDLWIHGHIHDTSDYEVEGVRVACNPRGYDGHQIVEGFDAARVIAI